MGWKQDTAVLLRVCSNNEFFSQFSCLCLSNLNRRWVFWNESEAFFTDEMEDPDFESGSLKLEGAFEYINLTLTTNCSAGTTERRRLLATVNHLTTTTEKPKQDNSCPFVKVG